MKAMTYRGPYKVRIEEKDIPEIEHPNDAIVRVELAAICGLSVGHFVFAFKQSMGISPHGWLRRQRIDMAKALLRDPALSLSFIASSVGFANQSAFGVAFRKEAAVTPSEWRRRHWM